MLKKLLQNQQNLKADGIYSCTGIYFFKSAVLDVQISTLETHLVSLSGIKCQLENEIKKTTVCVAPLGVGQGGAPKVEGVGMVHEKRGELIAKVD